MTARPRRSARVGLELLLLGALVVLVASGQYACPFHRLTGHPCPGCGLTRATWALARGDLGGALAWHPLVGLVLAWLAVAGALGAASLARGGSLLDGFDRPRVRKTGYVLAAAMAGVWIARFFGALGGPVP